MDRRRLGLLILVMVTIIVDVFSLISMYTISNPDVWLILTPEERALENIRLTALVGFIILQMGLSAALLYAFFLKRDQSYES